MITQTSIRSVPCSDMFVACFDGIPERFVSDARARQSAPRLLKELTELRGVRVHGLRLVVPHDHSPPVIEVTFDTSFLRDRALELIRSSIIKIVDPPIPLDEQLLPRIQPAEQDRVAPGRPSVQRGGWQQPRRTEYF